MDETAPIQALVGVGACAHWLVALLFLVVGVFVVRKAHRTAGALFAGAGAAHFLAGCCATAPRVWLRVDFGLFVTAGPVASLLATGAHAIGGALLIASFVLLSRHALAARPSSEGGAP